MESILDLHRYAGVAERGPSQAAERGHFLGHLVEQTFDGHKAVLAGDVVDEVMQKFPFGARVAGRFHGLHEFLNAAFAIGERAAFFRVRTTGQNKVRELGRIVRQNVADDERVELREQFRREAVFVHDFADVFALALFLVADRALDDVLAENDERFNFSG